MSGASTDSEPVAAGSSTSGTLLPSRDPGALASPPASTPVVASPIALNTQLECAAGDARCTAVDAKASSPLPVIDAAPQDPVASAPPIEADRSPKKRKPKFSQTYIVAFMGDSITDYRSGGGRFISVLERHCPHSQFDNYGKGGEMTNQMRRRFKRDVFGPKKPPYTHVVVFGGVNDLYSDLTAHRTNEKIQSDLSQMYTMAREGGVNVIALTVAPWGGFTRYYNKSRGTHTRELNAWIVGQRGKLVDDVLETSPILSCGDPEKLCKDYEGGFKDGLHFGREGHEKLGEALFQQVFHDCR